MSTQIFMMLIIGVSIIRFFKGIFNKKQTQFKEEVAGFLLHVTIAPKIKIAITVVFIVVIINYYELNITSPNQEAKHSPGKVIIKY